MDAALCRTLSGPDLRERPHQLDAGRGLPVRRVGCHRGRHRRDDLGRRRRCTRGFRGRPRWRSKIGGVRTNFRMPDVFFHRPRRRLAGGRRSWAASRSGRARSVGYRLVNGGAGLRRRHADDHRCDRGGGRPRGPRRPRQGRSASTSRPDRTRTRATASPTMPRGGRRALPPDPPDPRAGHRGRRRVDPGEGQTSPDARRCCGPTHFRGRQRGRRRHRAGLGRGGSRLFALAVDGAGRRPQGRDAQAKATEAAIVSRCATPTRSRSSDVEGRAACLSPRQCDAGAGEGGGGAPMST